MTGGENRIKTNEKVLAQMSKRIEFMRGAANEEKWCKLKEKYVVEGKPKPKVSRNVSAEILKNN